MGRITSLALWEREKNMHAIAYVRVKRFWMDAEAAESPTSGAGKGSWEAGAETRETFHGHESYLLSCYHVPVQGFPSLIKNMTWGFHGGSAVKNPSANAGDPCRDLRFDPWSGKIPAGHGSTNPMHHNYVLQNPGATTTDSMRCKHWSLHP